MLADSLALDLHLVRAGATDWSSTASRPSADRSRFSAITHRIAISNSRIVSFDGERISFRYRDYAHGNAGKLLTLDADEFLRRFLLHVLPPRLVRIRYYGFLANRTRANRIELPRQTIGGRFLPPLSPMPTDGHHCLHCNTGTLRIVGPVPAERPPPSRENCCDHLPFTVDHRQAA